MSEKVLGSRLSPLAPEALQVKILKEIGFASQKNGLRRGVNEVIKSINRDRVSLVVIAYDSDPCELVLPLPDLCENKNVPYVFVDSKEALGRAAGTSRPVLAIGINNVNNSKYEGTLVGYDEFWNLVLTEVEETTTSGVISHSSIVVNGRHIVMVQPGGSLKLFAIAILSNSKETTSEGSDGATGRTYTLHKEGDSAELKGFLSHFKLINIPEEPSEDYFNYEHTPESFKEILRKEVITRLALQKSKTVSNNDESPQAEDSSINLDSVTVTGVLVECVPKSWSVTKLQEIFSPYGVLESVRTVRNGTAAFVNYQTMQEARIAAIMMNGYVELDDHNNSLHEPLKLRATHTKLGDSSNNVTTRTEHRSE